MGILKEVQCLKSILIRSSEAFPTSFKRFHPCQSFLILSSTRKRCTNSHLRGPVKLELIILSLSSIAQKLKFAGKGIIQIHMLYI